MTRPPVRRVLRGVAIGLGLAALVVGAAIGLFVLAFGWDRFMADFWPLDNSRVGPNLVASVVTVILITAHNEYRTAVRGVERGDSLGQLARALENEVLHPAETAEQHIADYESGGTPHGA